nr:MAG TPA: hypothetical protein [Caudoviricetes sp.]
MSNELKNCTLYIFIFSNSFGHYSKKEFYA